MCELRKFYDIIPRHLIWHCLRKRNALEAHIGTIQAMYTNCTIQVRTNSGSTEVIENKVGLHQRSTLGSLLCIFGEDTPSAILFTGDLVLCYGSCELLEVRLVVWREKMAKVGLKISRSKTEFLPTTGKDGTLWIKKYNSEEKKVLPVDVHSSNTLVPSSTRKGLL